MENGQNQNDGTQNITSDGQENGTPGENCVSAPTTNFGMGESGSALRTNGTFPNVANAVDEVPKIKKRKWKIVALARALAVLVIGISFVTGLALTSSRDAEVTNEEDEAKYVAQILDNNELENFVVESEEDAEGIVATFDAKIAEAGNDEEKANLLLERVYHLVGHARSGEGLNYKEQVLMDAYTAEEILKNSDSAMALLSLEHLSEDEELVDKWSAVLLERSPDGLGKG